MAGEPPSQKKAWEMAMVRVWIFPAMENYPEAGSCGFGLWPGSDPISVPTPSISPGTHASSSLDRLGESKSRNEQSALRFNRYGEPSCCRLVCLTQGLSKLNFQAAATRARDTVLSPHR